MPSVPDRNKRGLPGVRPARRSDSARPSNCSAPRFVAGRNVCVLVFFYRRRRRFGVRAFQTLCETGFAAQNQFALCTPTGTHTHTRIQSRVNYTTNNSVLNLTAARRIAMHLTGNGPAASYGNRCALPTHYCSGSARARWPLAQSLNCGRLQLTECQCPVCAVRHESITTGQLAAGIRHTINRRLGR